MCGVGESTATPAHAKCPIGYYCPVQSSVVVQIPCSKGKYGTSRGASTEGGGCTNCPAGSYCPGGPVIPIPCPAGAYCPGSSYTPTLCSAGTYNKYMEKQASGDCLACQGGEYCPAGSSFPLDCPAGQYCAAGVSAGTSCAAGKYLPLNNIPDNRVASASD